MLTGDFEVEHERKNKSKDKKSCLRSYEAYEKANTCQLSLWFIVKRAGALAGGKKPIQPCITHVNKLSLW